MTGWRQRSANDFHLRERYVRLVPDQLLERSDNLGAILVLLLVGEHTFEREAVLDDLRAKLVDRAGEDVVGRPGRRQLRLGDDDDRVRLAKRGLDQGLLDRAPLVVRPAVRGLGGD